MIICKELNKSFETKDELFKALRDNKKTLIAQKKAVTKYADAVSFAVPIQNEKGEALKSDAINIEDVNTLKASLVINTTNLLDSHSDVHIKGIWNKSVKEQRNLLLLKEHVSKFESIISDEVKASVKEYSFKDLGFDFEGKTQALIFDASIEKDTHEYMFKQYAKGKVKEHSVGMRYVKLELALNSESKHDIEEKAVWDKYISDIANKEVAEEQGYFWAVIEAKVIEGSAVVKGSNFATPTLNIEAVKQDTSIIIESSIDTQKRKKSIL